MRWMIQATLLSVLLGATVGPVRAGIYNPQEFEFWPSGESLWPLPNTFSKLHLIIGDLRGLPVPRPENKDPQSVHFRYWSRVAQLESDERAGILDNSERIELGACYLRLRRPDDARRVLQKAEAQDPGNFMILANLAASYQLTDDWLNARAYLERRALQNWPESAPGFTADQLRFYRRVEKYHVTLIQQRMAEASSKPDPSMITVDALFPGWEPARGQDEYGPGACRPAQAAELPEGALAIVEQLVLWFPHDDRLYWLLGELLNARGNVREAAAVLDELVFVRKYSGPDLLRRHRQVLLEAVGVLDALDGENVRGRKELLLWALIPRGQPVPAGVGLFASECVGPAIAAEAARDPLAPPTAPAGSSATGPTAQDDATRQAMPPASWLPDPRAVAVGFAAGIVVTVLAGLQLREIRRRREQRAGSPTSGAG